MPEKTKAAQANLRQAGLDHLVECYTGEGADFIAALPERVDFVFVDFGLPAFAPMFTMLESRLVPRGIPLCRWLVQSRTMGSESGVGCL